jgi:hypothetical protein
MGEPGWRDAMVERLLEQQPGGTRFEHCRQQDRPAGLGRFIFVYLRPVYHRPEIHTRLLRINIKNMFISPPAPAPPRTRASRLRDWPSKPDAVKETGTTAHLLDRNALEGGDLAGHVGDVPGQRRVADLGPGGEVGRIGLEKDPLEGRLVAWSSANQCMGKRTCRTQSWTALLSGWVTAAVTPRRLPG